MKELLVLTAQPATLRFAWENYIFLNNMRERGLSDKTHTLVFVPHSMLKEGPHEMWKRLEKDFPETKFFYFFDKPEFQTSIQRLWDIFSYIPILRPYCIAAHFKTHPELSEKAIFYTDSDILLTQEMDFEPFQHDDINYMSDAKHYTNIDYFDSKLEIETNPDEPLFGKPKWVQPEKYEALKKRDIPNECAKICGITRETLVANRDSAGAAQYLLKNVDYNYWNDVFNACLELRMHLMGINQTYMRGDSPKEKEDNGWQSWCADIWAVTWNLLRREAVIKTPKEFDFTWATDEIKEMARCRIFHNAGITADEKIRAKIGGKRIEVEAPAFYKSAECFIAKDNPISPFDEAYEPVLNEIIHNPVSQLYCTGWMAREIKRVKDIYNL